MEWDLTVLTKHMQAALLHKSCEGCSSPFPYAPSLLVRLQVYQEQCSDRNWRCGFEFLRPAVQSPARSTIGGIVWYSAFWFWRGFDGGIRPSVVTGCGPDIVAHWLHRYEQLLWYLLVSRALYSRQHTTAMLSLAKQYLSFLPLTPQTSRSTTFGNVPGFSFVFILWWLRLTKNSLSLKTLKLSIRPRHQTKGICPK